MWDGNKNQMDLKQFCVINLLFTSLSHSQTAISTLTSWEHMVEIIRINNVIMNLPEMLQPVEGSENTGFIWYPVGSIV